MPVTSDNHSVIPVLLVILDGVGCRDAAPDNPVSLARIPNWDRLWQGVAHTPSVASDRSVGLPSGPMGNAAVGPLYVRAGRAVHLDFPRLDRPLGPGVVSANPIASRAAR